MNVEKKANLRAGLPTEINMCHGRAKLASGVPHSSRTAWSTVPGLHSETLPKSKNDKSKRTWYLEGRKDKMGQKIKPIIHR